jgi:hypothetical protein
MERKKAGIKVLLEKHYTSPTSIIKPPVMTEVNVVVLHTAALCQPAS